MSDPSGRIVISGLTKTFGAVTAVDDLSFTVEPGSITGFLGPNGAGKTTTLRMLLGLVTRMRAAPPSAAGAMPRCRRRTSRSARCWRPPDSTPPAAAGTTCGCSARSTATPAAAPTRCWRWSG